MEDMATEHSTVRALRYERVIFDSLQPVENNFKLGESYNLSYESAVFHPVWAARMY